MEEVKTGYPRCSIFKKKEKKVIKLNAVHLLNNPYETSQLYKQELAC